MRTICIIQARMGSSRLPGKVLLNVYGKTILEHDIERLKKVKNIDDIVIATTTNFEDDVLQEAAKKLNIKCFRGSESNVLSRYFEAAKKYNADVIVRVTSDCPLIDPEITTKIIRFYLDNSENYDYVSNSVKRTYPRGLDTEVFSFKALEKAYNEAELERDKEHVTPYIWDNSNMFRIYQYTNEVDYSDLRWTLDTKEDFILITRIYKALYKGEHDFYMQDIINLYEVEKDLKDINAMIEQKKV